ncbi:MAG: transketolase [Candidatus Thermoplasmatota archaeon]|nr:transketolase [Candidatus Thermoplasmatota archaeon]
MPHAPELILSLERIAAKIRIDVIKMIAKAGTGHPGGSLSATDVMTALYFHHMRHDPKNPKWEERDRFVLSKGHVCPALYSAMAESGYFPVSELMTLRQLGTRLQGHPAMQYLPGLEITTGSLGQGLSAGLGMALAARVGKKEWRVYCMMGDGENDEGQIWEAAMAAGHFKTDNLTAILDRNSLQIDGCTENVMCLDPIADKWRAFGWNVIEIDGHSMEAIMDALDLATTVKGKPTIIIAKTVKGKGVSFMENNAEWHGKAPNKEQTEIALKELEAQAAKLGVEVSKED